MKFRLAFGASFVAAVPVLAQQPVSYELRFPNAVHHEAEIQVTFRDVRQPVLEVVMSRSSPGRYALHEFAKNVYNFHASDAEGNTLPVERPSPYGWNITGHHGTVIVEYTLFGDMTDGTYAAIDQTHAHLNLPAILAWAHGYEHVPSTLKFDVPLDSGWTVATQLEPLSDGTWRAPDLESLMDSPVEISRHFMPEWKVGDSLFRLSLHDRGTEDEATRFAEMCKAVVTEEEGVFGAFPKYDTGSYTFLIDYLPYASGDGMEHRDSTVITDPRNLSGRLNRAIEVVSHEFFHSWNVRRIRPRSLEPFDFERADMSGELWFAEGFTNYYGPLALERSGLSTLDEFAGEMGYAVNTVLTAPGRKVFDVIDMSQLAPFVDAARSVDPTNRTNTFISYYTYGQALALGIDLAIRETFPGKSLDDWMRTMWRGHPDIDKPYTLNDLESALAEATGSKEWAHDIFEKHIFGKEPMAYEALLAPAGMLLKKQQPGRCWLGAPKLSYSNSGVEIAGGTLRDSPLYLAGLDNGDKLLEFNGKSVTSDHDLTAFLSRHKPGDHVNVRASTRAGEKTVELTLKEDPALEMLTFEQVGRSVTPAIKAFRTAWLGSKAIHPLPKIPAGQ